MLPKLSPAQRAALEDFAWLKQNIADLTRSLRGAITINISGGTVHVHEDIDPFDKVPFTWMHVENALALPCPRFWRAGLLTFPRPPRLTILTSPAASRFRFLFPDAPSNLPTLDSSTPYGSVRMI